MDIGFTVPTIVKNVYYKSFGPVSLLFNAFNTIISYFLAYENSQILMNDVRYASFFLRSNTTPNSVKVKRGDYTTLKRTVLLGGSRFLEIDGPTGCGKSTEAVWELLQAYDRSILIVCPTLANAVNVLTEFNERIPRRKWASGHGLCSWVPADLVDYTQPQFSHCRLHVITAASLRVSLMLGRWPPVDMVLIDEYHLEEPDMVFVDSTFRELEFPGVTLFASATPRGRPVPPPNMADKTLVPTELPALSTPEAENFVDPKNYLKLGSGVVCTIVSGCVEAHSLSSRMRARGTTVHCICPCSTFDDLMAAFNASKRVLYVITPSVEAGITLKMNVFIDYRTRRYTTIRSSVAYEITTGLTESQGIQRTGRAGRIEPTLIMYQKDVTTVSASNTDLTLYQLPLAILMGATDVPDHLNNALYRSVVARFPKIGTLTTHGCQKICEATDYISELYKRDSNGVRYREFGGSSLTYVSDHIDDFKMFKKGSKFFFAPLLDLTKNVDYTEVIPEAQARAVAAEIVRRRPALSQRMNIDEALAAARREPSLFAQPIFDALKARFEGVSNACKRWAQKADALADRKDYDPSNNIPGKLAGFWDVVASQGGRYRNEHSVFHEQDKPDWVISPSGTQGPWIRATKRLYSYRGVEFCYQNNGLLMKAKDAAGNIMLDASGHEYNVIDPSKVEPEILRAMEPTMAASLINTTDQAISLDTWSRIIDENGNDWVRSFF